MSAGWRRPGSPRISASTRVYDPSLPPVWGNRDQLVQVLLNLVKNAAEAITDAGMQRRDHAVTGTSMACGWRCRAPTSGSICRCWSRSATTGRASRRTSGRTCSTRSSARSHRAAAWDWRLVAKIVADHGGLIEVDSRPGRTEFRLHLPVVTRGRKPDPAMTCPPSWLPTTTAPSGPC